MRNVGLFGMVEQCVSRVSRGLEAGTDQDGLYGISCRFVYSFSVDEPCKVPKGRLYQIVTVWMEKHTSCVRVVTCQHLLS